MKFLKLIPATTIFLAAFLSFEAKAGWHSQDTCTSSGGKNYELLSDVRSPNLAVVYVEGKVKKNGSPIYTGEFSTAASYYAVKCNT